MSDVKQRAEQYAKRMTTESGAMRDAIEVSFTAGEAAGFQRGITEAAKLLEKKSGRWYSEMCGSRSTREAPDYNAEVRVYQWAANDVRALSQPGAEEKQGE